MLNRFRGLKPSSKKRSKRRPARHHKLFRPTLEALEPRAMLSGTTITVNTTADGVDDANISGPTVTLREAINYADADTGNSDTITFVPSLDGQTIALTMGELLITNSMTITGPGASQLTISGGGNSRIFDVDASDGGASQVAITGLTLTDGNGAGLNSSSFGGAIFNAETLTLTGDTISGNLTSNGGGGIYNEGTLASSFDTISGNSALAGGSGGGGIYNEGTLVSSSDTISGNSSASGGGIANSGEGVVTSTDDTISGNSATASVGGGIFNQGGSLILSNDTISGNSAGEEGGGIFNGGTLNAASTIVAGNTVGGSPDDIDGGGFVLNQNNLVGLSFNGQTYTLSQILATDSSGNPLLANNGGPTQTIALVAGSPAIGSAAALETLAAPMASTDTTATVNSATFLTVGESLEIDSEIVTITAIDGDVLTLARGQDGTTATSHDSGAGLFLAFDQRGALRPEAGSSIGAYQPQNLVVNTTADTDPGDATITGATVSLRQAIDDADAFGGASITFAPSLDGQTITLTQPELAITNSMTITGPGASQLTISAGDNSGIFGVNANDGGASLVAITGLTLSNGNGVSAFEAQDDGRGGAIYNAEALTLSGDTISGNAAQEGGGIYNAGTLTLSGDTISGNSASLGGGISNLGTLTSTDDTISGNTAYGAGGIYNQGGSLVSSNDTISGNTASLDIGGGIYNEGGTVTATNDTISGNTAATLGGGVYNYNPVDSSIYIVNLADTIIAGNTAATGPDISGVVESQGGNLIGDGSGASGFASTDIVGTDALPIDADLGPLGFYGGPTETIPLLAGSPAIAAASPLASLATEAGDKNNDSGAINSGDTTATVDSTTFLAVGESLEIDSEIVTITAISGDTLTLLRGQDGTTATKHSDGAGFFLAFDQRGVYRETNDVGAFSAPPLADTTPVGTDSATAGSSTGQQVLATFTTGNQLATAASFSASVDWGGTVVGTPAVTIEQTGSSPTSSSWEVLGTAIYTEAGTFTVTVGVTETDDGQSVSTSNTSFAVADAPLAAGTITGTGGVEGVTAAAITATFTDANIYATSSDFSGTIIWGDGTSTNFTSSAVSGSDGSFTISGSHLYTAAGSYSVSVAVNDVGGSAATIGPTLTSLAAFTGANESNPTGSLIVDGSGNVFGTTEVGGTGDGTVFEIAAGTGTVTTLATFNDANGRYPVAGLLEDSQGDLFGTTALGGQNGDGTVFEIPYTASGYGALETLATFTGSNGAEPGYGSLVEDAQGDLFGTTLVGGTSNDGTVFEIPYNDGAYGTITTLATFDGSNGANPYAGLTVDAAGDLFGTTAEGGAYAGASGSGDGTIFEIANSAGGYGQLVSLASFDGTDGANPVGNVVIDPAGNLYGTTELGGTGSLPDGAGTIYELPLSDGSYGPITTLATFDLANGFGPTNLIRDAAGDLFGTTQEVESPGQLTGGTVFELPAGSSTVVTLAAFSGANGSDPVDVSGLAIDAAGDLLGTTVYGGPGYVSGSVASGDGTVFEVSPFRLSVATAMTTTTVADTGGVYDGEAYPETSVDAIGAGLNDTNPADFTFSYVGTGATTYGPSSAAPVGAGTYSVTATYDGDANHQGSTSNAAPFTISQAAPTVGVDAVTIAVGTALANSQLSGTATYLVAGQMVNVVGTFTYTSAAGAVLAAGNYSESVTFTPTADPTEPVTTSVAVAVLGPGSYEVGSALWLVGGNTNDNVQIIPIGKSNTGGTGIEVQGSLDGKNLKTLTYNPAPTVIYIYGYNGNDTISMATAITIPAVVSEGNGNDNIQLGQGNNSVTVGSGNDQISAGNGNNVIVANTGSANVSISLGNGDNTVTVADTSRGNASVQAGAGSNSVTVGNGNDQIELGINSFFAFAGYCGSPIQIGGGTGNNTVVAGNGNDFIMTGGGNDAVTAGNGNDALALGDGNNRATIGNGNDYVQLGNGNNTVAAGSGNDLVQAGNGSNVVTVGGGDDQIELGIGSFFAFAGYFGSPIQCGGGVGNNTVVAGNGNDFILLGSGSDAVTAGNGNDVIVLGDGNNTLAAGNGNDIVQGGDGNNVIVVGSGNDVVNVGNGNNVVQAGNGNDTIQAGNGDNLIVGGLGHDTITAGNGDNILIDGSVQLTQAGDTLQAVLDSWIGDIKAHDTSAEIDKLIAPRLAVTYNTTTANTLIAGSGLDWFWDTYAHDHTSRNATDLLN